MKILFLPNWKVMKCNEKPIDIQSPDYNNIKEKYWFFKYFREDVQVDIIDIKTNRFLENIEKNKLHFYIIQSIKAFFKMKNYDVVISHGMPSGIFLALLRRIFKTKKNTKHIVFDIGCFNSAAEKGKIMKFNQFASKSIDGIICHESKQLEYYEKFYPWLVSKTIFIPFGTDLEYFERDKIEDYNVEDYILSIGFSQRDNETMIKAFSKISTNTKLIIIGPEKEEKINNIIIKKAVPKRKLNEIIQKSKFCILPLENKNFSFGQMTLLQQMYYGKLVITAKVPSMLDYVKDEENAILYESKNVNELKTKIEIALVDEKKREEIGKNARKIVIDEFNERKMAIKIEEFINKIMLS